MPSSRPARLIWFLQQRSYRKEFPAVALSLLLVTVSILAGCRNDGPAGLPAGGLEPGDAVHASANLTPAPGEQVDQQQLEFSTRVHINGARHGQSFTAGLTGNLSRIDVMISCVNGILENPNLRVWHGAFSADRPFSRAPVLELPLDRLALMAALPQCIPDPIHPVLGNDVWMTIQLPEPLPVVAGEPYTFLTYLSETAWTPVSGIPDQIDRYAGGTLYMIGNLAFVPYADLVFRTWVTLPNTSPAAVPAGPYQGSEGSAVMFDGSASTDPDGDAITYAWDFGDGSVGSGANPNHTYADEGTYTVTLTVSDDRGGSDTEATSAVITNVAPVLGALGASTPDPIAANSNAVTMGGSFTDVGVLDTHTATIDWGDGSTGDATGTVAESPGAGTVSGSHTYATAGVYRVAVTIDDQDGGADTEVYEFIVVFDPNTGVVAGHGRIESPPGAYAADQNLSGHASFGFVSRYKKGMTTPDGNTEFQFKTGNLSFESTSYDWLVVAGARAQIKGSGTINGAGNYGFMLTAIDSNVPGGGEEDRFRIRIWDRDAGDVVVYDNQMGDDDAASVTTAISAGSIRIQSK